MRTRLLAAAAVPVSLVAIAVDRGASSVAAAPAAATFKATSTLDGKTVLPRHIRWVASTTLPASQVATVSFLIDGKVHWTETAAPLRVLRQRGQRSTSATSSPPGSPPAEHRFTVQVKAKDGRTAADNVTARVLPAPAIPAALAGTWQRTLAHPVPPDPGAPASQPNPAGTYTITFERRWIQDQIPGTYNPKNNRRAPAASSTTTTSPARKPSRCGAPSRSPRKAPGPSAGGWWCYPDGPPATYTWTVTANKLTLAPVGGHDACGQRGTTWTGTWTRIP